MVEIVLKPNSVSWDEISQIVYNSHVNNREKGLDIRNANLTGDEIKESIGVDGRCFIARDTNLGIIIGTVSVAFHHLERWYAHGLFAYLTLDAVLPEWSGKHVFSRLSTERMEYIKGTGCEGIYIYIAENNKLRREIAKKEGFISVAIDRTDYNRHNYITYVKWFGEKPFCLFNIRVRFVLNWIKLKSSNCLLSIYRIIRR